VDTAVAIREARARAGLTQAALARRAGTSQATLSAYENGAKQPSLATFGRLLAATGGELRVGPGPRPAPVRSAAQLRAAGRTLAEVIGLAEALPSRHAETLRYPRLGPPPGRPGP
jgi:transcriptional regulator with XRE-family HTH domain